MRGRGSAVSAALELSDHFGAAAVVVAQIYIQIYIQNGTVCSHFCPSATQKWLACEHSERRIPGLRDANWQAPWFPASSRQSVTHLRNAKGGCVGGLKRKVLVLNGPNRPKRPKNGRYQAHRGQCSDGYGPSEAPPFHTSHPRAHLRPLLKTLFFPFVRSGA